MSEPCGFCSGRGWHFGRTHDSYGYQRHDSPPRVTCEYCGGTGRTEGGNLLLPAIEPDPPPDPNAGNPAWG